MLSPPIIWYGSKWHQREKLIEMIGPHKRYMDVTLGGGSVSINKPKSKVEVFSDLDPRIINLYQYIKKEGKEIANIVSMTEFREETYKNLKPDGSDFDSAVKFLIKNRMSFQGTGRGFIPQLEPYWYRLPGEIIKLQRRLRGVTIECCDLFEKLRYAREDTFLYIDPPYMFHDQFYQMTFGEHELLLEKILRSKGKILITHCFNNIYAKYLSNWQMEHWKRRSLTECVWTNYHGSN